MAAEALGEKAPVYDLCKVSVRGTNLFCADALDIERDKMPQFLAFPKPGSEADKLPRRPRGHYTEYTVRTPGSRDRGARRIVAAGDPARSGEYYYSADHYRSFQRIRE